MSTIKLVSSDSQLLQVMRQAGLACETISADRLESLAQPGALQTELLVLDLRGQQRFPPAVVQLKRQHPTTGVLLVASQLDPALMLEAMRAGVNECVVDPVSVPELQAAVNRLQSLAPRAPGEVFAFVGAKGGVGTTTVAANVATALAKSTSESPLLIDLNVAWGDAAVFLGVEPRFSTVDALENVDRLDLAFFGGLVVRSKGGVDLLGAAGRPVSADIGAPRIRALLDFASQTRRYTVLDLPRSDSHGLGSLETATRIVLVANQELATVRTASRMAATLGHQYGRARLALVVTRTDKRAEIGLEDIERTVGLQVCQTFPSDYPQALQALNKGRPIVLDQNELSGALRRFARELAGLPDPDKTHTARTDSVFARFSLRRA